MEKGLPVHHPGKQRGIRLPWLKFKPLTFSVIVLTVLGFRIIHRNFDSKRVARVPFNGNDITARCNALNMTPGPPPGFDNRSQSDRYQLGTPDVLIRNATIWTGGMDGNEIITGDILLTSGLIEWIGTQINVTKSTLVTTIDAAVSSSVFRLRFC